MLIFDEPVKASKVTNDSNKRLWSRWVKCILECMKMRGWVSSGKWERIRDLIQMRTFFCCFEKKKQQHLSSLTKTAHCCAAYTTMGVCGYKSLNWCAPLKKNNNKKNRYFLEKTVKHQNNEPHRWLFNYSNLGWKVKVKAVVL